MNLIWKLLRQHISAPQLAGFFFANLINNIPRSILSSTLPAGLAAGQYQQAIYASIAGSNIGAFLTPIGALAGIMFTELTDRYQVDYGFRRFLQRLRRARRRH